MMLGVCASLVPQCGHSVLAAVIPAVIGNVFANAGVELDMEKLIDNIPSDKTIHTCVTNNAVDTIILNQ